MSGYQELRDLGVVFRPPDSPLPPSAARWPVFRAPWSSTIDLLAAELRALDARGIAVELDLAERDLRLDGIPRADARIASDSVRISFTSKWGPLRYETGEFTGRWGSLGWQQNLRAIALSMEALRAVDRYGVSKRGEQYRGWRALPMGAVDPVDLIATEADALKVIALAADRDVNGGVEAVVREALRRTHPDRGGDATEFRKVMKAREILGV